jgi:hypothetical protein
VARGGSTVAKHLAHHLKAEGLNPAPGNRKSPIIAFSFRTCFFILNKNKNLKINFDD